MTDPQKESSEELSFRPRARLLQLLGDQLIGTPRLAVFELVKNAYDADAQEVLISLNDIDDRGRSSIVVEDDGEGMTEQTIKDIWLVPAHDHKEIQRQKLVRTKRHRLPLGEKGVGRFAVHKLGEKIKLISRAQDSDECVVEIDWSELISKPFLSDAKVAVRTRKPNHFTENRTGTRIEISNLREAEWTKANVRRLYRQVTSISSPFSSKSDRFAVNLKVPRHPDWISEIPDVDHLLDHAPWHFKFVVKNGLIDWSYEFRGINGIKVEPRTKSRESDPLKLPDFGNATARSSKRTVTANTEHHEGIGDVTGTFFVWDRDRVVLSKMASTELTKNFLDENGGVRVYRDGIRVYNYGEDSDDWLNLDLSRVNTPTRNLSRNITVGAIDLNLESSTGLKEKTNREGFVENETYENLRGIVLGALSLLQIERKKDKDRIRSATKPSTTKETKGIDRPIAELRKKAEKHSLSKEFDPLITRIESKYEEMRDSMLRAGLSGMGLAIVFHEIEQGVRILQNAVEKQKNQDEVLRQAKELVRLLDGFSNLLRKGDAKTNSVKKLVRRARDLNSIRFRAHGVKLICPVLEDTAPDLERKFAFGLMLGALNNLIDNSLYWLQVRWPEPDSLNRKLYVDFDPEFSDGPAIIVADNGPGIEDEIDQLTSPFFSRRPDGMGVGLYYTNMVMEMFGGKFISLDINDTEAPPEFDGAAFALVFRKSGKT